MRKATLLSVLSLALMFLPYVTITAEETTREFTQAEKCFEAGKYPEAEKWYLEAAKKYQGMIYLSSYIQSRLGECYQYQRQTEEAVQAYRKVQKDYPTNPIAEQAQEKIARAYYDAGNYGKAGPEFEKLADQHEAVTTRLATAGKKDKMLEEQKNYALKQSAYSYYRAGNKMKAAKVSNKLLLKGNRNLEKR